MADYQCQVLNSIPTTGCVDGYYLIKNQYFDIRCSSALSLAYTSSKTRQDIYDCSVYCGSLSNCIGANFDPADNSCQIHSVYQGFSDTPIPAVLVLTSNPCGDTQTTSTTTSSSTESTTSTSTSESTTSSTSESITSSTTSESTTSSSTSTTETTSDTSTSETTTSETYTTTSWTTTEPSTTTWTTWTTPVLDCTPWTEEEECDDENGGTYTKTHTIYPTGCQSEDKFSTQWEHWKTTEWESWPTTTQAKSTNTWVTWSKPTPSTESWDDWYTTVTVITTKYVDVCSTGYVTVPYTKTVTWSHPQATTTNYVWPVDKDGCPSGFTTTTSMCAYGCGKPWATVTVTIPIKDESINVDNWAWLTKTVDASAWTKTTAAETKATNSESWSSWSAEPSSKVKVWTGAASGNVVGSLAIVMGGMIAGFLLL